MVSVSLWKSHPFLCSGCWKWMWMYYLVKVPVLLSWPTQTQRSSFSIPPAGWFLPWVSLSACPARMCAKLASTWENTRHKCTVPAALSPCKMGMVSLSQVCKACQELRTDVPWGTLALSAQQSFRAAGVGTKIKTQCWELGPTLCLFQGLARPSLVDWTPFSSWNMLDVFLKHILQFGFVWK